MHKPRRPRGISLCHQLIISDKEAEKINFNALISHKSKNKIPYDTNVYRNSNHLLYQS